MAGQAPIPAADRVLKRTDRVVTILLILAAASAVIVYVGVALVRIGYPFELEWMEGGTVDHIRRILAGRKLYVAPSLEFVPYFYTPLYFYLSALVCKVLWVGFAPLRLVSLLSSVGCLILIFSIVRRETGRTGYALLASAAYAATFRICGSWFDIARVDSLFLLLLLAGVYLLRFNQSPRSWLAAGLLFFLAFFTKQTGLLIAVPLAVYGLSVNRRAGLVLIATLTVTVGGSTAIMDRLHDGWYRYYIFELGGRHGIVGDFVALFWIEDLLLPLAIACAVSVFYLLHRTTLAKHREDYFYLVFAVAMVGASWFSRCHTGSYYNSIIPACAAVAVLFGLGAERIAGLCRQAPLRLGRILRVSFHAACLIQFAALSYDPRAQVPADNDRDAGMYFLALLREMDGDVYVPYHGYLPALAGKKTYAQYMAVFDVLRVDKGPKKDRMLAELKRAIEQQRFSHIILDKDMFIDGMERFYVKQGRIFKDDSVFWPITGHRVRPTWIYVPRNKPP